MQAEPAWIETRSRRQAMDWSLVLISQGIQAVIEPPAEEHGWRLAVARAEFDQAIFALKQYRRENRRPGWRQELPWTGLMFDWRSVVWLLVPTAFYALGETGLPHLKDSGVMDSQAVWQGQWWRLFTAIMLHADLPHLAANVSTGFLLLGLAMGACGPGLGLLAAYLAGAGGNIADLVIYDGPHKSLGASGMVMGALGVLSGHSLAWWRAALGPTQWIIRGALAGVLLLVLFGFDPSSDVVAHVGGFAFGVVLGFLVSLRDGWTRSIAANRVAELAWAGMVMLTWWLALGKN